LFETWYAGLQATQGTPEQRRFWADLLALREGVSKVLEEMRKAGTLGASLEAEVAIHADAALRARYAEVADELRFFFITSALTLADAASKPADAARVALADGEAWVTAAASGAPKCVRCWHHRADVGAHAEHPGLCGRCVENVAGAGEDRRYF
ncbi:MAG TPA: zinc finger domain-containing protein, partial [Mizugakiibacter sp.]